MKREERSDHVILSDDHTRAQKAAASQRDLGWGRRPRAAMVAAQ